MRFRLSSIGARARLADQLSPLGRFNTDKCGDLFGAHISRLCSKLEHLVVDIGRADDLLDVTAELLDNGLRRLARRKQGVPAQDLKSGKSLLRNGRNIR